MINVDFIMVASAGTKYGRLMYSSSVVAKVRASAALSLAMLQRSWSKILICDCY